MLWEISASIFPRTQFLFASPSLIFKIFYSKIISGELIIHFGTTSIEVIIGLLLGLFIGSSIGFALLYSPIASKISKPYILALASIPIFGIAPMMIIWFGIGIPMKIAMVFFSTVFVALSQAYQGGKNISKNKIDFFKLNGASKNKKFWNLIFPSSIDWLIQSFKLNSGLAILGAFIGEFIASDKGLGYIILKASGLYDVPYVLAAILCILILSLLFNTLANYLENNKLKIIRLLSVNTNLKINNDV